MTLAPFRSTWLAQTNRALTTNSEPGKLRWNATEIAIIALAAAGLLLRLTIMPHSSYWGDELYSVCAALEQTLKDFFKLWVLPDNSPPTYFLILRVWINAFGSSEAATRLFSALSGCAAVITITTLTSSFLSPRQRLLAATFISVNSIAVYFSQEVRSYSLLLMSSTFVTCYYFQATIGPQPAPSRLPYKFAFWSCFCGLIHFYGTLLAGALALDLFRRNIRSNRGHALLYACSLVPPGGWILFHIVEGGLAAHGGSGFWYPPLSITLLISIAARFLLSANSAGWNIFIVALQAICLTGLMFSLVRKTERAIGIRWEILFVTFAPLLIAALISLKQPIMIYRNCLVSLPAAAILFAVLFHQALGNKLYSSLLVLYTLAGLSGSAILLSNTKWTEMEPWRSSYELLSKTPARIRVAAVLNDDNLSFRRANEFYRNEFDLNTRIDLLFVTRKDLLENGIPLNVDAILVLHGWRVLDEAKKFALQNGFTECTGLSSDSNSAMFISANANNVQCRR